MKKYELTMEKFEELFPCIKKLSDRDAAEKTLAVWKELFELSSWDSIEDACFMPELGENKLYDHINVATESALLMAELIERIQGVKLDADELILIGLLHDASKIVEFEPAGDGTNRKSEIGEKITHGVYGALYAHRNGFSVDMLHLILTHTPQSRMKPLTKEAHLFCTLDIADADVIVMDCGLPSILER